MFEVFETGVELDAVDDFFPVTEGLESDPDGVENVIISCWMPFSPPW